SKHEARRLDVSDDMREARWVKPGESFVAHGAAVDNYPIFGLRGDKLLTMSLQGDLTKEVVPAPDGSALVVGRTDNQYVVANVPNGDGRTLVTAATDLAFSPDGRQAVWTGLGNLDKDGNFHPGRTIYVSLKNVITGFAGAGMAITSQFDSDGILHLAQEPWSPD